MTTAGNRLIEAAKEALAIAKGEAEPATYVLHRPPEVVDVKAIRHGLSMTQRAFGERFGFGVARVRDWEQRRTKPAASDRVLLTTIRFAPDIVLRALAEGDKHQAKASEHALPEKRVARRSSTKPSAAE